MGAWIEITYQWASRIPTLVAPVWGRGLKSGCRIVGMAQALSPPYGGVD